MSKDALEAEFRSEMRLAINELRYDIKKLIGFRAWLFGVCAAVSAITSLVIAIYFGK